MNDSIRKVWSILDAQERRKALLILLLTAFVALVDTLGVLSIAPFLLVLSQPTLIDTHAGLQAFMSWVGLTELTQVIVALAVLTIVMMLGSALLKSFCTVYIGDFVQTRRQTLSSRLLTQYLAQPYEFFLLRNPSELVKNVLSAVDQIIFDLLLPVAQLVAQGLVAVVITLLIISLDPVMALVVVVVMGALYGLMYRVLRHRLVDYGRGRQLADEQRYKLCFEMVRGIKDVKMNHAAPMYLQDYAKVARSYSHCTARGEAFSLIPMYVVEAIGYSGLIGIALVMVWRAENLAFILPTLGLYGFAAYRLLPAVQAMYRGYSKLRTAHVLLENFLIDLNLPLPAPPQSVQRITPRDAIVLDGVAFAYPSTPQQPIFTNLNVRIPARTITGLSGKSGAGKSTLMDIVLGLLEPQQGTLRVDGEVVTGERLASWQASIGYVPQHIYIADVSMAQNIAFGVPPEQIDHAAVERAARAAQLHDFIVAELPQGYTTCVGDNGIRLSGGQRQRVGIARALYRDPPVLCMDEATSALDNATEEDVNRAIQALAAEKTIILIAHRASTLRYCQYVIQVG